jgi:uncharacterized protein (TIGR02391 family)
VRPHTPLQLARRIHSDAQRLGLALGRAPRPVPPKDPADLYDWLMSSEPLRSATRKLFMDGHYAEAVEEAYKCVNNTVKSKSGLSRDGQDLMHHAFSEENPVLKLNALRTASERDEQAGYRLVFAGCMTGIRNPRAHGHDLRDDPQAALELLVWANHLMRVVAGARRVPRRRKVKMP